MLALTKLVDSVVVENPDGCDDEFFECIKACLENFEGVTAFKDEYLFRDHTIAILDTHWEPFGDGDGWQVDTIEIEKQFLRDSQDKLLPVMTSAWQEITYVGNSSMEALFKKANK